MKFASKINYHDGANIKIQQKERKLKKNKKMTDKKWSEAEWMREKIEGDIFGDIKACII